jgi:MFS family permease
LSNLGRGEFVRRTCGAFLVHTSRAHRRVFRSLAVPNYRLYFAGHAVSVAGTWMQRVAQDWLVLELSNSAVALAIATSLQFLPTLVFGLWGGVLVDRLDRRRTIMITQAVSAILAAALAAVVLTNVVSLWMVYALALCLGFVTVVDVPARQAFVTEMVGPEDYVNAQALNSTVHNAGRLVGPALAGVLIATVDVGAAFAINALSFAAVLLGLARMDTRKLHRLPALPRARGQARQGLRYVWQRPELRACILLVAVVALLGQNFRVVLPLLARDTFGGGAEVYGWLTSALGVGAVLGALASAARVGVTAWSLLIWTWVFAAVNVVAALAPGLGIALAVMVALGVANICFNTLARTLLQLGTDPTMQGRVIALHSLVFLGSTPLGGPVTGWVCERWGPRSGLLLAGISAGVAALVVMPQLRRTRRAPAEVPDGGSRQPSPAVGSRRAPASALGQSVEREPGQPEPGEVMTPDVQVVEGCAEVGQFGDVPRREVGGAVTESRALDADAREHVEVERPHDGLFDGVRTGPDRGDPVTPQDADRRLPHDVDQLAAKLRTPHEDGARVDRHAVEG